MKNVDMKGAKKEYLSGFLSVMHIKHFAKHLTMASKQWIIHVYLCILYFTAVRSFCILLLQNIWCSFAVSYLLYSISKNKNNSHVRMSSGLTVFALNDPTFFICFLVYNSWNFRILSYVWERFQKQSQAWELLFKFKMQPSTEGKTEPLLLTLQDNCQMHWLTCGKENMKLWNEMLWRPE